MGLQIEGQSGLYVKFWDSQGCTLRSFQVFIFPSLFVIMAICTDMCMGGLGCQRCQMPLGMRLQAVVSHLIWVLGPKLTSFVRTVYALTSELSLQP